MTNDLISREAAVELLRDKAQHYTVSMFATSGECHVARVVATEAAGEIANMPAAPITGDTSDGYHTFDELYHHRAVLFSVIVKAFPDKAWKARKHHDGSMYDGMFIVGIETPDGQATYHMTSTRTGICSTARKRSLRPSGTGTRHKFFEKFGHQFGGDESAEV